MKNLLACSPVLLLAACGTDVSGAPGTSGGGPLPAHKPVLEMFVMSQCPYGVQVEKAITPVKEQLGDAFELKIDFIGKGEPGAFTSMHGPSEVRGDIAQLCVNAKAPDKLLPVLSCMNENMKTVDTSWKDCAANNGVDAAAVEACVNGDEGQQLLAASFKRAQERKATGSPTMFLDGVKYSKGRTTNDFLREICSTYGDDKPQVCKDIPEPPKVAGTFLSDSRCKDCADLKGIEGKLKSSLPGLTVTHLDYNTPEGQALYAELKAADASFKFLPAALLSADIDKAPDAKQQLGRYLTPIGSWQSLKVGAKFDPTAEICDNSVDDDGNGLSDCADEPCKPAMACREEKKGKLDLFVMSQCPYGAKAMIAAMDALPHFGGGDIDLDVHFIGDEKGGKLSSMHGQAEVDLNLVEICAMDKYPDDGQFVKFLGCVSKEYKKADWKPCAAELGMNASTIEACATGSEGQDLLRASYAEAQALGISSSPTFLVNNRRKFNAVAPDKLQREFCTDNPGLSGCSAVIPASIAPPQGGGGAPGKPAAAADPACGG